MTRTIDLNDHVNQPYEKGMELVDFGVQKKRLFYASDDTPMMHSVPNRYAVVRQDTGDTVGIVSGAYKAIEHRSILEALDTVAQTKRFGVVPRGVYVDQGGARMRALYKFPELQEDGHCPLVRVENSYDGTSKVRLEIGAFTFVCTNMAVGGRGVFAGGFISAHVVTVDMELVAARLEEFLARFGRIMEMFRWWKQVEFTRQDDHMTEQILGERHYKRLGRFATPVTVYDRYAALTNLLTHRMRTPNRAFELIGKVNEAFQERWPLNGQLMLPAHEEV